MIFHVKPRLQVSEATGVTRQQLRKMHDRLGDMGDVAQECRVKQVPGTLRTLWIHMYMCMHIFTSVRYRLYM